MTDTERNLDDTDEDGRTELFTAAMIGDGRKCRSLLEQGADIQHVDRFGYSVAALAQDKSFHEVADFLETVRTTKWRPGLHPSLMEEVDYDAQERNPFKHLHVREISAVEMALEAVGAEKYVETFLKHKINYVQLLHFNDALLREVGVEEEDIREKILDHIDRIDKAEWSGSMTRMELKKRSGFSAEVLCMLANIEDHLQDISSTMGYITHRTERTPQDMKFDKERNRMEDIIKLAEKTANNADEVGRDAMLLHNTFGRLLGLEEDGNAEDDTKERNVTVGSWGAKYLSVMNIIFVGAAGMGIFLMLKLKKGL